MRMRFELPALMQKTGARIGSVILMAALFAGPAMAQEPDTQLSEREFLIDIPLVYSASRLPQQAQDVAGAITIIDREMIRASGARDLTDLFRLVPGFQVGTSSGGKSVVAYHGLSGQISQRMQVYVDGRSLYAPYLFGGVDWSALSLPMDEIERIEIQRGSNSVSYGANAFLGVVHIITRAAAQSVGWYTQVTQGSAGIADRYIRWGQSTPGAQWRVAAGTKADDGLANRTNPFSTQYLDLRAEVQPSVDQELSFFTGLTQSRFGIGFDFVATDPVRKEDARSLYLLARYKRTVDPGQEWSLSVSHTYDTGNDSFAIPLSTPESIQVNNPREAHRSTVSYQHFKDLLQNHRASWGWEYSSDQLIAPLLFNTADAQTNHAWRAYINDEWKLSALWTLNFGGLIESSGLANTQFAPRFSINWKPNLENAVKLGYSSAFRTPSLFEQRADWRTEYQGQTLDIRYLSTGGLVPEQVRAWDLVYTGQLRKYGLTLDARLFKEEISQIIGSQLYLLPADPGNSSNAVAYDLQNSGQVSNTGLEYQLSWRPTLGSMLIWNRYLARPQASSTALQATLPENSSSLLLSHTWDGGLSSGLWYAETAPMRWLGEATSAEKQRIVSLRLAKTTRIGDVNTQLAAVWRNPLGRFDEFRELQRLPRQFWINLSVEY